eukprot:2957385-Rhodomonas_salina.1
MSGTYTGSTTQIEPPALRACYAMSGTDIDSSSRIGASVLRMHYPMSGTELCYAMLLRPGW